jgi:thiamine pyrophosphokinase
VDGALRLFSRLSRRPHLIIGDFDSASDELLAEFAECEKVIYERIKDQTDGELALRLVLERRSFDIDIYGGIDTDFESDQMLANIFNLTIAGEYRDDYGRPARLRLVDHCQHIYLLESAELTLTGRAGNKLSILPLSDEIQLSVCGVRWQLDKATVKFGSSWPLRNDFIRDTATVTVSGRAVVIHRYA